MLTDQCGSLLYVFQLLSCYFSFGFPFNFDPSGMGRLQKTHSGETSSLFTASHSRVSRVLSFF